ncbi:hypothetical protein [Kitasatospora phosalacinea]|uniref:hypothetical protein n=1 Tax=Kitasatospora phosalacinea TaxID=2065 RepID=UPI00052612D5|nr:hypothetical protein [Kitasatospora phosalacinea]
MLGPRATLEGLAPPSPAGRSAAARRRRRGRPPPALPPRRGLLPAEPYADPWPCFRPAAAGCFTARPGREVRDGLALAFPPEHRDHLPQAAPLLAGARRIAEREPGLDGHRRLLEGATGYGAGP